MDQVPSLKHFVYIGDAETAPSDTLHYEQLILSNAERLERCDVGGDDVYGIFYTGGTTGKSKGVMLTHTTSFYAMHTAC